MKGEKWLHKKLWTFQDPESPQNRLAPKPEIGEGFSDVVSEKFSAYNLAGELVKFLRTQIANRNYVLAKKG